MVYLLLYDINNDQLRTKLAKKLKLAGLRRIQKSVFMGKAYLTELQEIVDWVRENQTEESDDSVFIFNLDSPTLKNYWGLGEIENMPLIDRSQLVYFL